jgi:hypothetical protein
MKLMVVFEVPDDKADAYGDVAARMAQRHAFAEQQAIAHWSFDLEMRPVAAVLISDPASLLEDMAGSADTLAALLNR